MRNPVGTSAKAKLDRAKFHLKDLGNRINSGELHAGQIGYRIDYKRQELIVFTHPDEASLGWSILAGEVIHQARSALEHIVWELIENNGGVPKVGVTGFPVFWDKTKYKRKFRSMVDGINAEAFAIIDGLQPLRPDYTSDSLYLLHEMWNRDKHRILNTGVFAIGSLKAMFLFPNDLRAFIVNIPDGPLPQATEIERRRLPFRLPPEVKVTGEVWVAHKFVGGPADGKPFLELLSELCEFAERIVDKLIASSP